MRVKWNVICIVDRKPFLPITVTFPNFGLLLWWTRPINIGMYWCCTFKSEYKGRKIVDMVFGDISYNFSAHPTVRSKFPSKIL